MDFEWNQEVDVVSTSELDYDLMNGSDMLDPSNLLSNKEQAKKVQEALDIVRNYKDSLMEQDFYEEM